MGADNWGKCPQCKVDSDKKLGEATRKVAEAYSKVSPEEYSAMQDALAESMEKRREETLREDYEIGTNSSGIFSISYGCGCDVCGFQHSYQFKQQLKIKP